MIVGIQYKANIFERNQQQQGPEDERHSAQNTVPRDRHQAVCMGYKENLPEGIEDGSPNISIDDTAGPHDEQSKANTHQCASVCRMLVRGSTDRGVKQPHHSSFQKEEKRRPVGALLVQTALARGPIAVGAVHNAWTRSLAYDVSMPARPRASGTTDAHRLRAWAALAHADAGLLWCRMPRIQDLAGCEPRAREDPPSVRPCPRIRHGRHTRGGQGLCRYVSAQTARGQGGRWRRCASWLWSIHRRKGMH